MPKRVDAKRRTEMPEEHMTTNPALLRAQKERQEYDDLVSECASLSGMGEVALEDRFFEWLEPTNYGFLEGIRAFRKIVEP